MQPINLAFAHLGDRSISIAVGLFNNVDGEMEVLLVNYPVIVKAI